MQNRPQSFIGKVQSVTGGTVSVQLEDSVYRSSMPIIEGVVYRIGQIGSFVKIPLGYSILFGVVTQAGVSAIPEKLRDSYEYLAANNRWLTVELIGEIVRKKFERGVAQFPTAQDEVHLVTTNDLKVIYGDNEDEHSICVGQISASESLPAYFNIDKLLTRHSAIVGSTGSGKSNTVTTILTAISQSSALKSQRVLIIDPHGEYSQSFGNCKVFRINADIKKGEEELKIPFWALPFEEFISLFPGRLNDSQKDALRMHILKMRISSSKKLPKKINENSITSDSPLPFSLSHLWFNLDDFERQTFQENGRTNKSALISTGDAEKFISNIYPAAAPGGGAPFLNNRALGILSFLDGVKNRALDERFKFIFQLDEFTADADGNVKKDLDKLLSAWLGHNKQVTVLDLSGIPPEIMVAISGSVLKIIYDALFWGQNLPVGGRQQPLLVVLEEAHNYLQAGEESIASRTVQTIAKEGRKYGVGLMLVTQRPSELNETTLSQCGTVIALRMTNLKDRSHISSAIQDNLQDLINVLPSLRTGEGLAMGESIKIPSRIRFEKLNTNYKSSDPKVVAQWKKNLPDPKIYENVMELWRSGKFK